MKQAKRVLSKLYVWIAGDSRAARGAFHLTVGLAALIITVSHRPDSLLNPQFWAEDGRVWYADAYNLGAFYSLFKPEAGYFQTVSRLVASIAQILPFAFAPLFFNICAIAIKVAVVNFVVSSRMSHAVSSLSARLFLAFIYLALPHSFETTANLTNAQWHLAFLAFLVIVATPAKSAFWKIFDTFVIVLSALSGPFCILLLPIAVINYYVTRKKRLAVLIGIIAAGSIIQVTSLMFFERPSRQPLGASIELLAKIIGGHLFVNSIFGDGVYRRLIINGWWNVFTASAVSMAGVAMMVYGFIRGHLELRLFIGFSLLIVVAALGSPTISDAVPQWTAMWPERVGSRYWLIPISCFLATLLSLGYRSSSKMLRISFCVLLGLSIIGILGDWRHPRFIDLQFPAHAANFQRASTGQEVIIPINPNWEMRLIKKEN